jgi:hypothetical protein
MLPRVTIPLALIVLWSFEVLAAPREVSTLVEQSRNEGKRCEAPYQKAKSAGGEPIETSAEGELAFADRAHAMAAMTALEAAPTFPRSSSRLLEAIQGASSDGIEPLFRLGDCHGIGYFALYKHLIHSAKLYDFARADKARVHSLVMDYVSRNLEAPLPFIDVLIQIALTRELAQSHLVDLTPAAASRLQAIFVDSERVKRKIRARGKGLEDVSETTYPRLSSSQKQRLLENFRREQGESDRLRADLRSLVSELAS